VLAIAGDRDTALQLLESASDLIVASVLLRAVPVTCVTTSWLSRYAGGCDGSAAKAPTACSFTRRSPTWLTCISSPCNA